MTLTSLTLFAAFLLLFDAASGFRVADLVGAAPIRAAPKGEGLSFAVRCGGLLRFLVSRGGRAETLRAVVFGCLGDWARL